MHWAIILIYSRWTSGCVLSQGRRENEQYSVSFHTTFKLALIQGVAELIVKFSREVENSKVRRSQIGMYGHKQTDNVVHGVVYPQFLIIHKALYRCSLSNKSPFEKMAMQMHNESLYVKWTCRFALNAWCVRKKAFGNTRKYKMLAKQAQISVSNVWMYSSVTVRTRSASYVRLFS